MAAVLDLNVVIGMLLVGSILLGVAALLADGESQWLLPGIVGRLPGLSWNFDGDPTGIVMVRQ